MKATNAFKSGLVVFLAAPVLCLLFPGSATAQVKADSSMSFFISSANPGKGANLGGLAGADAHCQSLAAAVGAGRRTWHAYLSTQPAAGKPAENARDRIGTGPWYNFKGLRMAMSVEDLHSVNNKLNKENSLTEKGEVVNGRGDTPNRHDILTGSKADGTAFPAGTDMTCNNWTSETTGSAMLGHHDRHGAAGNIDSTSWNQAHASTGCSPSALVSTGGNGFIYCFAADAATGTKDPVGKAIQASLSGFAWLRSFSPGAGDQVVYRLDLPQARHVDAAIFTLNGRKLADLSLGIRPAGVQDLHWNGRDSRGNPVSRGFYLIAVTVR